MIALLFSISQRNTANNNKQKKVIYPAESEHRS